MRKNGLPLLLIAFVLLFLGFRMEVDWFWHWPISQLNYERIQLGMSLDEVKDIMGEKNAEYEGIGHYPHQSEGDYRFLRGDYKQAVWFNKTGAILVWFDLKDRVVKKERWLKTKLDLLDTFCAFLPLWSILLAEAIGLLIVAYLCWKWIKKFRRRSQLYTPTVTIPTFLSQDDDF